MVCEGPAMDNIEEPQQFSEVYYIKVDKVALPTHAGDGDVHCVQLS